MVFKGYVASNIVLLFRRYRSGERYLKRYKDGCDDPEKRLLNVEEMSRLVI
ncbi:MAG: hypothetical protein QXK89_10900 [Candidatus Bathyarchaeia archaeon]